MRITQLNILKSFSRSLCHQIEWARNDINEITIICDHGSIAYKKCTPSDIFNFGEKKKRISSKFREIKKTINLNLSS